MKYVVNFLFIFSCLWSESSLAIVKTPWDGDFRVEEFGEHLNDGSQVFLQYNFKINIKNNHASLFVTTWHALATCIGDYSLKTKSGILELYYTGTERKLCPYSSPQFEISRKGKNYYIRSNIFSYHSPKNKWVPLKHVM